MSRPPLSLRQAMASIDAAALINSEPALTQALKALPLPLTPPVKIALGETLSFCVRHRLSTALGALLVQAGADPNHAGPNGVDARLVDLAIIAESADWLKTLLALGADPNGVSARGFHPLTQCSEREPPFDELLASALLEAGSRPDGLDEAGIEAAVAAWEGDPIGQAAARGRASLSPLRSAVWQGSAGLCELLLLSGADPDPVHAACHALVGRLDQPQVQQRVGLVRAWAEKKALAIEGASLVSPSAFRL